MSKKVKFAVHEDGTLPIITDDVKVTYSGNEINTNWLLNKVLGTKGKQITKIKQEEILVFLNILDKSRLQMHDGSDSLQWLKRRINKRYEQSQLQRGESWENICRRYQYLLEQIDLLLALRMCQPLK